MSSAIARIFATVLPGLAACATSGCGRADAHAAGAPGEHGPPRDRIVVATSTLCTDLARTVCEGVPGTRIEGLMPAGVDPHLWRPTAGGARMLARAEVVVANGLRLEGRMADVLPKLARSGCTVFEASSAIPMDRWRTADDAHGQPDPHVWMDPSLWARAAEGLASCMAREDPDHAAQYAANAAAFAARCDRVAERVHAAISTIPPERRLLVTAHDAFGYFGAAFGIEVRGVQGLSTESETGLANLRTLLDEVVARGVPAVFVETSVPDRAVAALVEGARARGARLTTGGTLHSDALGAPGTPAGDWEGMMLDNARTIVTALGGDASGLDPGEPTR